MASEFDRDYYISKHKYSDANMTPEEHYDRVGWREGADPTPWFSTQRYLERNADVRASGANPFVHYLEFGRSEGRSTGHGRRAGSRSSSRLGGGSSGRGPGDDDVSDHELDLLAEAMDEAFYQAQAPDVDFDAISAAEHYASIGWRRGMDPSPDFSTSRYLSSHRDVAAADMNPLLHFLLNGEGERRHKPPSLLAGRSGAFANGRLEWSGYGEVKCHEQDSRERDGKDLSLISFAVNLAGTDLQRRISDCRSQNVDSPVVSVVVPCINEEAVTAECLVSLFNQSDPSFEIIVVDNGSSDGLYKALERHPNIKYIRFEQNIGFGPACNAGAAQARGEYLLFFNNDAQADPRCLASMATLLAERSDIGAVGPKILNFDGSLQEAGATIGPDGRGRLIGFGLDPNAPRFSYAREVEYISGAALMIRRALFESLGKFDDVYAPAYCEDVDLCLKVRKAGYKIYYDPNAIVAHHLSRTTKADKSIRTNKAALINRNRRTLIRRWSETLTDSGIRTIAFYLPQFHPVPQNDLWWGKGFTEWTNTTKAKPNFAGHRQPRLPTDLGHYDLRVPEVMEAQADLARRYGIDGFCYYYYWFSGDRVLEMPLERLLRTGKPDIPFCLCWANENWTRRWDGQDDDVLLRQSYDDEHALSIARDIGRYFDLDNYIRIDGKPIFLIYRIEEIPNPVRFIESCRNVWRGEGKGEVMVAIVESFNLSAAPQNPAQFGADITVEFPAHGMVTDPPLSVTKTNSNWEGSAHDYRRLAANFITRVEPGFKRIRSVLVGWDNTPRHCDRSLVLENATPGAFQAWLEWTYMRTRDQNFGEDRIVFINAWNEWAEGSYLEPDADFGHGYLEAVRNAKEVADFGENAFEE